MGEENRAAVERLLDAIDRGEPVPVMEEIFRDDVVMEYVQSGERVVGLDNVRGLYGAFAGLPKVTTRRILGRDDLWIAEMDLDYSSGAPYKGVFILEFDADGKVVRETDYFAEPFEPAEWRTAWVSVDRD